MIEVISKSNIDEALPLIRAYQEFYKTPEICDVKNRQFFSQFGESSSSGCQFLFRESGRVVGFATVYLTYTSTIAERVAVLNDLYTMQEFRGQGVGRKLLEHCRRYAKTRGAYRLQWVTAPDNKAAQGFYDSLDVTKSAWFFYSYKT